MRLPLLFAASAVLARLCMLSVAELPLPDSKNAVCAPAFKIVLCCCLFSSRCAYMHLLLAKDMPPTMQAVQNART